MELCTRVAVRALKLERQRMVWAQLFTKDSRDAEGAALNLAIIGELVAELYRTYSLTHLVSDH